MGVPSLCGSEALTAPPATSLLTPAGESSVFKAHVIRLAPLGNPGTSPSFHVCNLNDIYKVLLAMQANENGQDPGTRAWLSLESHCPAYHPWVEFTYAEPGRSSLGRKNGKHKPGGRRPHARSIEKSRPFSGCKWTSVSQMMRCDEIRVQALGSSASF